MSDAVTALPDPARLIYAISENCADLLYATGFLAPDAFLYFEIPGTRGVCMNALEIGRARKQVKPGVTVLSDQEFRARFGLDPEIRLTTAAVIEGLSRRAGIIAWQVPEEFPLGLARKLENAGLTVEPQPALFPQRAVKTPAEVELIRAAVRLAETGLARALEILRQAQIQPDGGLNWDGAVLTAETLRGEITAQISRHGGIAAHTIAAPGIQGADPHHQGAGPIRAGEPIILDIFPRAEATGYFGDLTRTVVKGHAPAVVRQAFAAVRQAQLAAIATVKAGVIANVPHLAALKVLDEAGFLTDAKAEPPCGFFHGLGHGLGLEIHEGPRVNAKAENALVAGNVITIEPGVYYAAWGGIRIEDVVVVTDTGCDNLTTAPVELEIP